MFAQLIIWDYWIDEETQRAYCMVYKGGLLMISESTMEKNNG